ncbi:MAG: zf-TFIIB domain-containing protein [Actinomycetota bacterium]|nr:zf-TFIIB domain-containing protein [Actinomycetota bacterium]PLS75855.1 MAG: hypothetical protein CYG61_04730 [Actinomycetota bacterium]
MNCPVDGETLQMSERQGVEVDYCPRCRGVWLDRGELDKVIDRASEELAGATARRDDKDYSDDDRYRRDERDDRYQRDDRHDRRPHKRKRSFLGEMFEFGD